MAALLCRIMLDGLAVRPPDDEELDRSSALAVADDVIQTWTAETDGGADARTAHVRAVARREFGRRGYEITTVRDIAAATDLPTGTVYRLIGSKEELLESIMRSFTEKVDMGSVKVIQCEATSIQKLDALNWVRVNALDQFPDEFRIELAWMRQTPPGTANPAWSFQTRLQQMETLLSAGIRAGEIRDTGASTEMLARCVLGIRGIPDKTLHSEGKRAALIHIRDTILRGIATGAEPSG
jgi:AcrR family transcriptional regulator